MDDGFHAERLLLHEEAVEVRVERTPHSPISIGHGLELYKRFIVLLLGHALPTGVASADVERVVVSESSCHVISL